MYIWLTLTPYKMKKILLLTIFALFSIVNTSIYSQTMCGGIFTDPEGPNLNYSNNADYTVTLYPNNPGEIVTVTFTSFNVEATWDALYVFNGDSINSPQISSTNSAGSVPGGLAGGFWGTSIPESFTSTDSSGSLTFRFRSDSVQNNPGWIANVTCGATVSCQKPTNASVVLTSSSTANLSWQENGTANQWEVLVQPIGSTIPNASSTGTVVSSNPYQVSGLQVGNGYEFYVRSVCATNDSSLWSNVVTIPLISPTPQNDECITATPLIVNINTDCVNINFSSIAGATLSSELNTCGGNTSGDVWFSFTPISSRQIITLSNLVGSSQNLNAAVYSGTCGNLTSLSCSVNNSLVVDYFGYIIGTTYYVRVWSNTSGFQTTAFNICVKSISYCENAEYFCGSTSNDPYIFPNTTGIPDNSQVACLGSIPNPTFYTLKVNESGPLFYSLVQYSSFDPLGNPTGSSQDVDFTAWGPFTSAENCNQITFADCPTCPNNTTANFYPFGNIVDCSYSGSFSEILSIPNALAGEYYKVLITNFSNQSGFIKLSQTNFSEPNSGRTSCSDKLLLVSFVDLNNNGIKDSNEFNFTFGTFSYQKNNTGAITTVSSPYGKYSLYDTNSSNTYDITYQIYPEYVNYYALSDTNFNDISIAVNSGTQTLFFPVSITQQYNDVAVSIVPVGQPVAGSIYSNKIVYKNLGITPASGTVSFNNNAITSINSISQSGVVTTATGFTFDFVNLGPYESRDILVNMNVPAIPAVNIGDVLVTNAAITVTGDINLANNTFANSQIVVASYDPNDKMEAHGGKILISNFSQDDYLNYTIRFQNTGNSNAINVRLEDLLDSRFDFQSIRMIAASHNYTLERINNHLVWRFENIQLRPAAQNEELSKGFVTFKIKLNPGFAVGNIIPNTANIYFDSNPAITTNTFNTEFVASLANASFNLDNILVYPNPSNDFIHIKMNNSKEKLENIMLYNVLGETVKKVTTIDSSQTTIDVSDLSKGIYLLEITSENKLKLTKKLVIK